MSTAAATGDWQPGFLDRALRPFTEVHTAEGLKAALLSLNIFLILTAYYVLKPVREALILGQGSAEEKSYLAAAQVVLLAFVVPLYGRMVARLPRRRLINTVNVFFVGCLVLFYVLSRFDVPLAVVFFLWIGIFNVMIVAQFWAFANDVYTEEQGKRLFALVGIGASMGAVLGAGVVRGMAEEMTAAQMFGLSATLLTVCAVLTQVVHVRETRRDTQERRPEAATSPPPGRATSGRPQETKKGEGAFQMVWKYRYLTYLAAFSVIFTLVNTNGQYMLNESVSQWVAAEADDHGPFESEEAQEDFRGQKGRAFFGGFFFYQNLLAALLQMFLVSRLVRYAGFGPTFFVLPVIALMGAAAVALVPVIAVVRVAKIAENATDYSINNTSRHMLWLPTTTEMKYQAKQAVDTFFVRMGDVGSAVTVAVLAGALGLGIRSFAVTNVVLVVAWLFLARAILKERKALQEKNVPDDPTAAR